MTVLLEFEVDDDDYPFITNLGKSNEENFAEHIYHVLERFWEEENKNPNNNSAVDPRRAVEIYPTTKVDIINEYLDEAADNYDE